VGEHRLEQLCAWTVIALLFLVPLSPLLLPAQLGLLWIVWIMFSVWAALGGAVKLATSALPLRHSPRVTVVITCIAVFNAIFAAVYLFRTMNQ